MTAVYKRELRSYFITPIGYIFAGMFLAVSGLLFSMVVLSADSSGSYSYSKIGSYFVYLLFVFAVLIPLLTMKLLSEEKILRFVIGNLIQSLLLYSIVSV